MFFFNTHVYKFIHCSSQDPLVIEIFKIVAPINGTLEELEKKKQNKPRCNARRVKVKCSAAFTRGKWQV